VQIEELIKLVEAIKASDFDEFILEAQDVKMTLRRGVAGEMGPAPAREAALPAAPKSQSVAVEPLGETQEPQEEGLIDVLAPMVGTFYQAPSPGAAPFVQPGGKVKVGDTLCILEAMKLMNEIEAEIEGEVVEVAVKDGELVEYGQVLMTLRPLQP